MPRKQPVYEFEGFRLETGDGKLFRGAEQIALTHKAIGLLTLLIERHGETVSKDEILDTVWHDTFIDENNLAVTISMLRKAFGEKANDKRFIETVPKRGYRFVADVFKESEPDRALLVERRRRTHITIEEKETQQRSRRRTVAIVAALATFFTLGGLTYSFWTVQDTNMRSSTVSPHAKTKSLAVLPFNFDRSKIGTAKTAGEMAASLTEKLSSVASISSSGSFQSEQITNRNFLIVGQKFGVDAVLQGSLFEAGEQVYFRLHLINVHDGEILWAKTYQERPDRLPALFEDVVQNVSIELAKIADPKTYRERTLRYTANAEAYNLYLQGRALWRLRGDVLDDPAASKECFERALELDPNFALALVGLADLEKVGSYGSPDQRRAEDRAKSALQLASDLADARATLGFIRMVHHWDWEAAENEFIEALRHDPNCVNALQWFALLLALQMRHIEAQDKIQLARQLAPHSFSVQSDQAEILFLKRDHVYAIQILRDLRLSVPNSNERLLTDALWHNGDHPEAAKTYDENFGEFVKPETFSQTFAQSGSEGLARLMVKRYEAEKKLDLRSSFWLAQWYTVLSERQQALSLLERAADEHHFFIIYILASPYFDNLREEPRFHQLLRKINLYRRVTSR